MAIEIDCVPAFARRGTHWKNVAEQEYGLLIANQTISPQQTLIFLTNTQLNSAKSVSESVWRLSRNEFCLKWRIMFKVTILQKATLEIGRPSSPFRGHVLIYKLYGIYNFCGFLVSWKCTYISLRKNACYRDTALRVICSCLNIAPISVRLVRQVTHCRILRHSKPSTWIC